MSGLRNAVALIVVTFGLTMFHQLPHILPTLLHSIEEAGERMWARFASVFHPHPHPPPHPEPSSAFRRAIGAATHQMLTEEVSYLPGGQINEVVVALGNASYSANGNAAKLLASIKDANPKGLLEAALSGDASNESQRSFLASSVVREPIVLVDGVPRDANEFSRVFEKGDPSFAQQRALDGVRKTVDDLAANRAVINVGSQIDDSFRRSEKVLVFIAHNTAGMIALPNGTKESLRDLANRCTSAKKFCIFLSCDAAKYVGETPTAARRRLSVSEAADAVQLLTTVLKGSRSLTYGELADYVPVVLLASQIRAGGKKAAKFTIITAAPAGAVWIAVEYESAA